MKRNTVLTGFVFLSVLWLGAQEIKVLNRVIIPMEVNNNTSPQFSPDGSKILFTQSGFRGLWLYDLSDKSITQLNDHPGAGYEPVFTRDGRQIIFRVDEYRGMRKYSALAIQTIGDKKIEYLSEKTRFLSPATRLENESIIYRKDKDIKAYNMNHKESIQSGGIDETFAYVEGQKIVLHKNGERKELAPLGDGNYIWLSLSPDKTRMLFTLAGAGTFITDLEGKVQVKLGIANAPKWSSDGKWIVYMVDEDDGHTMIASDIWIASGDGNLRFQLTQTDDSIEMFPDWSPAMDKIVFDIFDGKIAYVNIEITD